MDTAVPSAAVFSKESRGKGSLWYSAAGSFLRRCNCNHHHHHVLKSKVPHADGLEGLRHLAPALAIDLLSFSFTGIYWLNHQHLLRRTEQAGHAIQCANLAFLFCLSLLPLSTAYVVEKVLSGFAVAVYAASLLIAALSFMGLRMAVHGHLSRRNALDDGDRKGLRNHLISLALYAGSIVAALYHPKLVLLSIAVLTFLWALPNLSLHQTKQCD